MKLKIVPLNGMGKKEPPQSNFGFGTQFSNRMFSQRYIEGMGWHDAKIGPYHSLEIDPAMSTLHYGQSFFEGCKAYRRPDGNINLFRTWENMKRFNHSAQRLAAPQVDEEEHLSALINLIELEHEWVPYAPGATLYIRPFMFTTDAALGVHAGKEYMHIIILSPVGSYFKEGFNPVPVYIARKFRRSVVGGTGNVKAAGNYAASLYVSEKVKAMGYSQVLWLDAISGTNVEEVGAMNFAVVYNGNHIATPKLTGSILPGVTRDSIIKLAPDLGYQISQTSLNVDDMLKDIRSGEITEVFGMGTAAVVAPIGKLGDRDDEYIINNGEVGPVTKRLFKTLTDIQYGRVPDKYDWTLTIQVPQLKQQPIAVPV